MFLDSPAVEAARDAEPVGQLLGVRAGLQPDGEDDHVHWDSALATGERVLDLDDQLAFLARQSTGFGDLRRLAANEERAFFHDALVELVVTLRRGPHIDVEVVDRGVGVFLDHVREFEALHAADRGAVVIEVAVAAADAMDDAHRLGLGHAVA